MTSKEKRFLQDSGLSDKNKENINNFRPTSNVQVTSAPSRECSQNRFL
jgi:hypothetical protein